MSIGPDDIQPGDRPDAPAESEAGVDAVRTVGDRGDRRALDPNEAEEGT